MDADELSDEAGSDDAMLASGSTVERSQTQAARVRARKKTWFRSPLSRLVALGVAAVAIGCLAVVVARGHGSDVAEADVSEFTETEEDRQLAGIYADYPDFTPPPAPTCRCQGWHGEADGYHWGASPDEKELCQRPWGGRYSPCENLHGGQCNRGAMRCTQPAIKEGDADKAGEEVNGSEAEKTEEDEKAHKKTLREDARKSADAAALKMALDETQPCLCVFDVDRTLTAKQWSNHGGCPHTAGVIGAWDNAYGRGELTLSAASARGLSNSSCGKCYVGICSHGSAGNWKEKQALADRVLDTKPFTELAKDNEDAKHWSWGIHIPQRSPLIVGVPDRLKQWAVEGILNWYWTKNITIPRERVWFFDDRQDNADNFEGTGMHSRQISCGSRDWSHRGQIGLCGISSSEIERVPGNFNCHHQPTDEDRKGVHSTKAPSSSTVVV